MGVCLELLADRSEQELAGESARQRL